MRAGMAAALVLTLTAYPALADNAKNRDGASSRSSSAGIRHRPSGGSNPTATSRAGSHTSSPPVSGAQSRHPRAGTGTGSRYGYYGGRGHYYPYYSYYPGYWSYWGYRPYYGYWDLGWWGYDPYWYGYGHGYGYGYRYRSSGDYGSVRLFVDPEDTRVFVDGYYAGVADDFDGIFQRLNTSVGRHEITLKRQGYRTHRMLVYVPYDRTLKIHHDMTKGSGEDPLEDMAGPEPPYDEPDRPRASSPSDEDVAPPRERESRDEPVREGRGELRLSIRPDDASVYVDGAFRGAGSQARSLELAAGRHRVEVVRPGFRTFDRDVEVRAGEPTEIEVDLERR